ncbi:hypothetical protein QTO34_019765 [Cnephaeus nilssonii]|uniref:DNA-directed RNA polymerase II subunit GRINL1A n=1 Tax=Cnephaeus nilssonii TaxID=3371016 RepID=A0AA40LPB5_CNENI|nr:hypothetical protein QTO34_019765 [Eptesicus nilssonii]
MATPSSAPESPPAADPALAAGAAEGAECPPPRPPQPPQNVLAAPRLRAPSSRGLGAAEFGGAAGDVEAPGETFAQRVSLGPAESPPGLVLAPGRDPPPPPPPFSSGEGDLGAGSCGPAPRGADGLGITSEKSLKNTRMYKLTHAISQSSDNHIIPWLLEDSTVPILPDNGKKILDSVVKLKAAIAEREEVRGKSELFHPISLDCKPRQKAIAVDVDTDKAQNSDQILDTSSLVPGCSSVDNDYVAKTASQQGLVHSSHKGPAEDNSTSSDDLFIDRLQRITIADPDEQHSEENTRTENLTGLRSGTQKKPHYMEVLDMRAKNPVPPPRKFKTNVLPSQQKDSPSHQQRRGSPVSSEERLRRDKQHLDDITAARLLPLHHLPAQLLSIEESLALQQQQKQSYEEMQAKLAAQKLAERLNIKMQSYNPEGESSRKYREVRDEDDDQSSDGEF